VSLIPIYYDTETTGIKADKDRIVEIAAFDPINNRTFCELVNPGIPIPLEASSIHHITDEMVAASPSFAEVGKAFIDFCGDNAVLIAHNNDAFDKHFLNNECARHSLTLPKWPQVDSLKWARKYRPDLPKHSLQFLREAYGITANQAHRALDDVIVLHQVFSYMIDDLSMETVIELLSTSSVITKMPFGKHVGTPLSQIPKSYVKWLSESGAFDKPENKDLYQCFEKLGAFSPQGRVQSPLAS
jgi:DNA polymerase-3 subunit epsilon